MWNLQVEKMAEAKEKGAKEVVVEGEHIEGAVLIINGNFSIRTRHQIETAEGPKTIEVFVFHRSLVDQRNKQLVKVLMKNKAMWTPEIKDEEENLFTLVTETTDYHLGEIAKKLAQGIPSWKVDFEENGNFTIQRLDD